MSDYQHGLESKDNELLTPEQVKRLKRKMDVDLLDNMVRIIGDFENATGFHVSDVNLEADIFTSVSGYKRFALLEVETEVKL